MIIDEIHALADRLGVMKDCTIPAPHDNPDRASEAAQILRRCTVRLGMKPTSGSLRQQLDMAVVTLDSASFAVGDRVEYTGTQMLAYVGKQGVVTKLGHDFRGLTVRLDGDRAERYFSVSNVRKVLPPMTIVNRLKAALVAFIALAKPTTANQAARELCAATQLCSIGDAAKKRAKKALIDLGIAQELYRPGTVRIYSDAEFTIDAVTKEASSRLDQTILLTQLINVGLSRAKVVTAIANSLVENKPATSIVVTELS